MSENLFGFSSQSFEQFIQAAATHVIGPGVVVFGSGPDGGREAIFDGVVPFPFQTDRWDGYGVIQAKCKEKTEGTAIDQAWALTQLRKELESFAASPKRKRKPQFYIFATNVVLTPAPESGGKDEASELIRSYYARLPLKDHRIWDSDQLKTFLNSYEELRRRFRIFLTSGDLFASLTSALESAQPDFALIASGFLDRQLRDDEDARLDQAGQRTDQRTALARVFVDLPAEDEASDDPPDESNGKFELGLLRELIEVGSRKLDAKAVSESKRESAPGELSLWGEINRWVLIGGPGSGKSTLSQFLAQLHRASILDRSEEHTLTPECRAIIQQIRELCVTDAISWPATPRFPFRIELSAFARALASEKEHEKASSLLEYLTQRMRGDRSLRVEDMLKWLAEYPWLLILDGLDEVPSSSNRDAVCTAVQDFLGEAARVNADLLLLATTRPEGYNNEFGKESFEYRYLLPLSIERSLLYAQRFAETRFGKGAARVEEMSARLREASRDELTARLMRTPLQVTFMATLVSAGGRPPRDRWKLFRDYYDTIYKREQQKSEGELRGILDKHDTLIHKVHHDVGFLLQVHGENAGATDAMMPLPEFKTLVHCYLSEDGWDEPDLSRIESKISGEARTRLVFLTSRIADRISFDVRSLQEHMAAECIMTGAQSSVIRRLSVIAPLSYWRNVFLFAAGQCFAVPQLQHLRALIKLLCDEMNDTEADATLGVTFAGSRLALDLLEDGTVSNTPTFARAFSKTALALLRSSGLGHEYDARPPWHFRMSKVYEPRLEGVFQSELSAHIDRFRPANVNAWGVLICLVGRGVGWANDLADREWPLEIEQRVAILSSIGSGAYPCRWLTLKLIEIVPKLAPGKLGGPNVIAGTHEPPAWLASALMRPYYGHREARVNVNVPGVPRGVVCKTFDSIFVGPDSDYSRTLVALSEMPAPSTEWAPYVAAARFLVDPCKENLASQLMFLSKESTYSAFSDINDLPWPLQSCLRAVEGVEQLSALAELLIKGELGDTEVWTQAERRWIEHGISLDDIGRCRKGLLPFDGQLQTEGFPAMGSPEVRAPQADRRSIGEILFAEFEKQTNDDIRTFLRACIIMNLMSRGHIEESDVPLLPIGKWRLLWDHANPVHLLIDILLTFSWPEVLEPEWLEYFQWLGSLDNRVRIYRERGHKSILPEQLAAAYTANPTMTGLLPVLGAFSLAGFRINIPERLLEAGRFENARFRLGALLVRMSQVVEEKPSEIAKEVASLHGMAPKLGAISLALEAVMRHRESRRALERFVLALREEISTEVALVAECDETLSWLIRRRNSGLSGRALAEELSLPWGDLTFQGS